MDGMDVYRGAMEGGEGEFAKVHRGGFALQLYTDRFNSHLKKKMRRFRSCNRKSANWSALNGS